MKILSGGCFGHRTFFNTTWQWDTYKMPRIDPLPRSQAAEHEQILTDMEAALNYVPNSFLTMARNSKTLKAVGALMDAFWYSDEIDDETRRLVTFAYSHFAGSHYSSAHCAHGAEEAGLARAKIFAIFDFERSEIYNDRERAILRLCRNAARMPAEVRDDDIKDLKIYYDQNTITYIVGLISMMAFLNKWNEILNTTLETPPRTWAQQHLGPLGWKINNP